MHSVQLLSTLVWRTPAKLKNFLRRLVDVFQKLVIKRYARSKKDVFFVQIGSNDADFGDPIKSHIKARCWRGIMVEAVPYVFERLKTNYESDRIRIVCCAITEQSGQRSFYSLKEDKDPSLPKWYDQLGSFRKDVILKHSDLIPDLESRIEKIDVKCLSYNQLLKDFAVGEVDLLHVDTEGYDYVIIRQVQLDGGGPEVVIFEHKHMLVSERRELLQIFRKHGYRCLVGTNDVLCIRRNAIATLAIAT